MCNAARQNCHNVVVLMGIYVVSPRSLGRLVALQTCEAAECHYGSLTSFEVTDDVARRVYVIAEIRPTI